MRHAGCFEAPDIQLAKAITPYHVSVLTRPLSFPDLKLKAVLPWQKEEAGMHDFLEIKHPTFDPKTVQTMADAFDAAWASPNQGLKLLIKIPKK